MTRRFLFSALLLASACKSDAPAPAPPVPATSLGQVPGHDPATQDTSHKETPRLGVAEAYLQTYLQIFGGQTAVTALAAQKDIQSSGTALFDTWSAYLGALGLPDYTVDLPRRGETNALMVATFERLGEALCLRAMEKDIKATPAVPVAQRLVFAFDLPKDQSVAQPYPTLADFKPALDVLHRTFLSYPLAMAPTDRVTRFYQLYQDTVSKHVVTSKLTAAQEGWAAMCSALVRHPEFHLY